MSLFENDIFAIVYLCVIIGLIILFVISFTLFIRRLFLNAAAKNAHSISIDKKLDKIIELLEKDRKQP
ncbi:DUF4083 domain-containing protein [Bacillus gaemokensis]|uniref:DNA mismatch repair protein MutT n=1 Tax=Bacillus gaemokensis TaxID=574375 RepID=A0A073KC66_9BACI|nr:DUF4083 domain-containing protein [Bacillus gaemokensis]KEK24180.1 DNA mismatch repair protein MutT [Bacillus gaemokensis]KYG32677.1 DNA mismatch repair protein MutT [Bacillus gaemokensis]